jgi:hypothetical protein
MLPAAHSKPQLIPVLQLDLAAPILVRRPFAMFRDDESEAAFSFSSYCESCVSFSFPDGESCVSFSFRR